MLVAVVPKHNSSEEKAHWHLIDQRFKGAGAAAGTREVCVCPGPEITMAVAAVVTLHAKAQRRAFKMSAVEVNATRKNGVGVRRARKADPSFTAQGDWDRRGATQIPGDRATVHLQLSTTGVLIDRVFCDREVKRISILFAEAKPFKREPLNETLRLCSNRKPRRPHLHRHSQRVACATAATRIHQEVPEPPSSTSISETKSQKPDLVSAPSCQRRIDLIESVLDWCHQTRSIADSQFLRTQRRAINFESRLIVRRITCAAD